jgi:hypothetical protein
VTGTVEIVLLVEVWKLVVVELTVVGTVEVSVVVPEVIVDVDVCVVDPEVIVTV